MPELIELLTKEAPLCVVCQSCMTRIVEVNVDGNFIRRKFVCDACGVRWHSKLLVC